MKINPKKFKINGKLSQNIQNIYSKLKHQCTGIQYTKSKIFFKRILKIPNETETKQNISYFNEMYLKCFV